MINTVKIQGNGFLVNGVMSVPNSPSNRHYQEIQEWIAEGNTPEPEFTQEELDQQIIDENNAKIKAELDLLDKQSIRDIREWIASQPDAPQMLKDREVLAQNKRGQLL